MTSDYAKIADDEYFRGVREVGTVDNDSEDRFDQKISLRPFVL